MLVRWGIYIYQNGRRRPEREKMKYDSCRVQYPQCQCNECRWKEYGCCLRREHINCGGCVEGGVPCRDFKEKEEGQCTKESRSRSEPEA